MVMELVTFNHTKGSHELFLHISECSNLSPPLLPSAALLQELEQVPLFMTQSPEKVDAESAPALAALQDLKYSEATPQGTLL